ncbi:MAG: hypothetical protein ACYCW6_30555, partial [Candidatus Xenobia bacterium]
VTQGDAHPANLLFDKEAGVSVMDAWKLPSSLDRNNLPSGAPGADDANYLYHIRYYGARFGLSNETVDRMVAAARKEFQRDTGVTPQALHYHMLREEVRALE